MEVGSASTSIISTSLLAGAAVVVNELLSERGEMKGEEGTWATGVVAPVGGVWFWWPAKSVD